MSVSRELLAVPTLLSLARVPLGVAFAAWVDRPARAFAVLVAAAATDVLDGWLARRLRQVTATGAIVDPLSDKWFVACVLGSLVAAGRLSIAALILLSTRELMELPLAAREWRRRHDHLRYVADPRALTAGKAATVLQFATIASALGGGSWTCVGMRVGLRDGLRDGLVLATAATGVVAGVAYWRRVLSYEGEARTPAAR